MENDLQGATVVIQVRDNGMLDEDDSSGNEQKKTNPQQIWGNLVDDCMSPMSF